MKGAMFRKVFGSREEPAPSEYDDYPEAQIGAEHSQANTAETWPGASPGYPGTSPEDSPGELPGNASSKPGRKSLIRATDAVELMEMQLPERTLLLDPWLPSGGLAMVYAPRGIGKTYFALEVALCVAGGGQFLSWEAQDSGAVLYLDGEMGRGGLQERLWALCGDRKDQIRNRLKFVSPDAQEAAMPDLSDHRCHRHLDPLADGTKLIIVDNISTLVRTGSENDAESWHTVQEWAVRQKAAGRTVLFIHHAGKSGGQRGTSKREDVMDTVIALRRPPDYTPDCGARFEIHFEKSRGFSGKEAEPFIAYLTGESGSLFWEKESLEESNYQKVADMVALEMNQKDIAEELGLNKSTVSRYARRARESK